MDIRRTETNSVNSINVDNNINTTIMHTSRPMPFDSTTTTINSYEVFMDEANASDKYRLILKVNPYCTNVLFNQCTEIVKDEGSDDVKAMLDSNTTSCSDAYGKRSGIKRMDAVYNTEYSREKVGYDYHLGYDIFDNHILRNRSYAFVNYKDPNDDNNREVFNTLADFARDNNGNTIETYPRYFNEQNSQFFNTNPVDKHVYKMGDILSFYNLDSVNDNLREDNGWYGFKNTNVIEGVTPNDEPMDINRVVNSRGNCDFMDMYPDRTLFSFTPKYNPYRRRDERNWEVILTYPYRNSYEHNVVEYYHDKFGNIVEPENRTNGLLVASCKQKIGANGNDVVLFRTFAKHGLSVNDNVQISYLSDNDTTYTTLPNTYRVTNTGDIKGNNHEYFFYLSDYNFINDLFSDRILDTFYQHIGYPADPVMLGCPPTTIPSDDAPTILLYRYIIEGEPTSEPLHQVLPYLPTNVTPISSPLGVSIRNDDDTYTNYFLNTNGEGYAPGKGDASPSQILNEELSKMELRVSRVYKGKKSDYYVRIFRKLPNWKYSNEKLTEYVSEHSGLMDAFIQRNSCDEHGAPILFDYNNTSIGFSNTIYNDTVAQYIFTDSIDVENLKDNRTRPLSEFFVTILKNNKGFREWYGLEGIERDLNSENVEYSHCFAKLLSGFNYLSLRSDTALWGEKNELSDVGILTDKDILDTSIYGVPRTANEWVGLSSDITIDDDEFVGDICEWNDYECVERVLEKACYRFNTAQREYGKDLGNDFEFTGHELVSDDYDVNTGGFNVTIYKPTNLGGDMLTKVEGYYYNPHYDIPIKKFGNIVRQDSHTLLTVKNATPVQADGIFIKLTTYGKNKVTTADSVYLCDDTSNLWYLNDVVYVDSDNTFTINVIPRDIEMAEGKPYMDWITTCTQINSGILKVRVRNSKIPQYASKVGVNTFLWRDLLSNVGSDALSYPFANGHNYIEHTINFFLKRQDPYGYNGLYDVSRYDNNYPANDVFPDVEGTKPIQETLSYDNYIIPDGLC